MNLEEELRNSAGKAEALANKMRFLRKSFLLTTSKVDSVLITIGGRIDRTIAKMTASIERSR
ncbi:hypothetical protein [Bacillus sp. RSS_NA_20]|uniref:hypothetical protein n=1 Tax=Bacillus sp. RSS_NA_20 TaxID=2876777 RepID=UPI001CCBBB81|nr:hypothetical protein [Bacillus sp. RSS_NA_20]MCA0118407.1 hypothetical protein [Bacillus sp. RSS_NA_20]